jgi:hypothetical protein
MHAKLQEAILAAGYEPLIIVGFGERNGKFSLKVGANPAVRTISEETWQIMRETIDRALDNLRDSPLDDLDIVR